MFRHLWLNLIPIDTIRLMPILALDDSGFKLCSCVWFNNILVNHIMDHPVHIKVPASRGKPGKWESIFQSGNFVSQIKWKP